MQMTVSEKERNKIKNNFCSQVFRILLFSGFHTGQCKRTGGCYNELVVAFLRTGDGLKGKKTIPVDFMIYL